MVQDLPNMLLNRPRHLFVSVAILVVFALGLYYWTPISSSVSSLPYPPYFKHPDSLIWEHHSSGKNPTVEIEGLRLGQPFASLGANVTAEKLLEQTTTELLERIKALGVDANHPQCSFDLARYSAILNPPSQLNPVATTDRHVSIALNLYNSQAILPSLSITLLTIVSHLKASSYTIYLSIYENSSEDLTLRLLSDLGAALIAINIDGLFIRHSSLGRIHGTERITTLSNLRNEALLPLLPYAGNGTVLFINDVVTCASDLLELLTQLHLQNAHAVASTDWYFAQRDPITARFRDIWVTRGINGEMPYVMAEKSGFGVRVPTGDYISGLFWSQSPEIWERWKQGLPLPVYSAWNGAIAISAQIFTEFHARFRASGPAHWNGGDASGAMGKWGELLATPGYLESDCSASECKLLARDIWNLMEGRGRILIAPQSRTAYSLEEWEWIREQTPVVKREGRVEKEEMVDWSGVVMPTKVACVPSMKDGKAMEPVSFDLVVAEIRRDKRIDSC